MRVDGFVRSLIAFAGFALLASCTPPDNSSNARQTATYDAPDLQVLSSRADCRLNGTQLACEPVIGQSGSGNSAGPIDPTIGPITSDIAPTDPDRLPDGAIVFESTDGGLRPNSPVVRPASPPNPGVVPDNVIISPNFDIIIPNDPLDGSTNEVIRPNRPVIRPTSPTLFPDRPTTTPVGPSNTDCAICAQFARASIAFNAPESMNYRQTETIELALTPEALGLDPEDMLSSGLPGAARTTDDIPYALQMEARLIGNDFTITASSQAIQTVLQTRGARWAWQVTPNTYGEDLQLTLSIAAVLRMEGNNLPPSRPELYQTTIDVNVAPWDRVVILSEGINTVYAAGAAIFGIAVAVFAFMRRRRPSGDKD